MEYQHGGDIYGHSRIQFDFSVNTNPFGMPEAIRDAVLQSAERWEQYPDCFSRNMRRGLADYYHCLDAQSGPTEPSRPNPFWEAEDFLCGNGASDLFYTLALALRPRKALLIAPAFSEYEKALSLVHCQIETFFLHEETGFSLEREAEPFCKVLEEIPDLDLVFLANPNNPNGLSVSLSFLSGLAALCRKKGAVLAIDECFHWFLPDGKRRSMMRLMAKAPEKYAHVMVFNAFTKIYAMPGLRMGFAACKNHVLLRKMEESRQPWSLSAPAEAAGLAALRQDAFAERTAEQIAVWREALECGLREAGFIVYPSEVNYLLFRKEDGVDYGKGCREQGILIRDCSNYPGLGKGFYRVSVKREEENRILIECLKGLAERAGEKKEGTLRGKGDYDTGDDVQCGKEPAGGRLMPDLSPGRISDSTV